MEFVDHQNDALGYVSAVDLVFDVIGGDIDFVVMSDRAQLGEIVRRMREGRPRTNISNIATLDEAVTASMRPNGSAGRRSSAFVRERHTPINASRRQ